MPTLCQPCWRTIRNLAAGSYCGVNMAYRRSQLNLGWPMAQLAGYSANGPINRPAQLAWLQLASSAMHRRQLQYGYQRFIGNTV